MNEVMEPASCIGFCFECGTDCQEVRDHVDQLHEENSLLRSAMLKAIEALHSGDGTSAECDAAYILDDALGSFKTPPQCF